MSGTHEQTIRKWAADRCEYCRMPEVDSALKHVPDHVIARQHGGKTELTNLALCFGRCNRYKGPNLAGIDPDTEEMCRLFHPRADAWTAHFRYDGAVLVGLTPIGRATVATLAINLPLRIAARRALIDTGVGF